MLTAELRVNGVLFGVLHIQRKHSGTGPGKYEYQYSYYEMDREDPPQRGEIYHAYADGAAELVRRCLEDMR